MNKMWSALLMLLFTTLALCGCRHQRDHQEDEINALWRQGYGFNNPNADRQRKGLPVRNFDGSID